MTPSRAKTDLPVLAFASSADWERWLDAQAPASPGVWLKLAKAGSGIPSVSKQEAVDAALCHGWIDGQLDKFDDQYFLIRFTPRRPKGKWSEVNRQRALALIEAGRMRAGGMREIERAKQDGRWNAAYAPQSRATVPSDFQAALDRDPAAKGNFAALDSANRYAMLFRIEEAKRPQTRAQRIEKFVAMLRRGDTVHPKK
jgi:uncharacterized protein YdeI (YjbR/CyaY-like superfamily)